MTSPINQICHMADLSYGLIVTDNGFTERSNETDHCLHLNQNTAIFQSIVIKKAILFQWKNHNRAFCP
ncbi:MAG: hypothetical protein C4522_08495 [Desulfobacteraceae bacterium]|nr:MAG: hypothetical protein C4522_08495 [Desulfobacteraceae bacterium]